MKFGRLTRLLTRLKPRGGGSFRSFASTDAPRRANTPATTICAFMARLPLLSPALSHLLLPSQKLLHEALDLGIFRVCRSNRSGPSPVGWWEPLVLLGGGPLGGARNLSLPALDPAL